MTVIASLFFPFSFLVFSIFLSFLFLLLFPIPPTIFPMEPYKFFSPPLSSDQGSTLSPFVSLDAFFTPARAPLYTCDFSPCIFRNWGIISKGGYFLSFFVAGNLWSLASPLRYSLALPFPPKTVEPRLPFYSLLTALFFSLFPIFRFLLFFYLFYQLFGTDSFPPFLSRNRFVPRSLSTFYHLFELDRSAEKQRPLSLPSQLVALPSKAFPIFGNFPFRGQEPPSPPLMIFCPLECA